MPTFIVSVRHFDSCKSSFKYEDTHEYNNLECALSKMVEMRRKYKESNCGTYLYIEGTPKSYWKCYICKKTFLKRRPVGQCMCCCCKDYSMYIINGSGNKRIKNFDGLEQKFDTF